MDIIQLQHKRPFGIGGRRWCFTHPHDATKCIKILRTDASRTIRGTYSKALFSRFRSEYDNNAHELVVLTKLHRRIGDQMRCHFPQCYGTVPTDLGPGLVLDLMRDHDGMISKSIRELISTGTPLQSLKAAYDEFGRFLIQHRIQTRRLLDHNLVARQRPAGHWTLFLIDGFGDPAWLPLGSWLTILGMRRIRHRVSVAWTRMEMLAQAGGISSELVKNSSWGQGFLAHRGTG